MKAWQFERVDAPLVLREVEEPTPGPGEVLIDIKAAGLCHTDVGILHEPFWGQRIGPVPLTLGHELAGVVSGLGPGVTNFAPGDRVGVFPAGKTRPGLNRDGGYSFKCTALAEDLVRMPAGIDYVDAALGTDAGRAAYRGLIIRAGLKPGDKVGIIGFGGLGQIAAGIGVVKGATVYVADPKESLWPYALELGVTAVAKDIAEFVDEAFDIVVDYAGFARTTAGAIRAVRDNGTVVQVGIGQDIGELPVSTLVFKQATLIGSRGGTVEDIAAVYELMNSGELRPRTTRISFGEIPGSLEKLHRGEVDTRLVAVYP